jgi:subtilisin family serine protease
MPASSHSLAEQIAARKTSSSTSQSRIASSLRTAAQMAAEHGVLTARTMVGRTLRLYNNGATEVYLHVSTLTPETLQVLEQHGVQVLQSHRPSGIVYATVAIEALDTIAALPFVRWIRPPSYSVLRTGSVTSEGDMALRAKELRDNLGIDGSGVRIGIMSDSLTDIQAAMANGDLPADLTIVNGKDGSTESAAINEGRAMAEIIHDLAPGAALFFHSAFPTSQDTIMAIQALTTAGVHILVDDVGFLDEPIFEDGPVAQAVLQAINAGVVYVTAAGNDAQRHYQGLYKEFDPNDGDTQINLHDFGGGDITLPIAIASGSFLAAFLQWPDPSNGSANTADYDLFVLDANGSVDACTLQGLSGTCTSTNMQLSGQAPPLETVSVNNNTGLTVTVTLVINRAAGAPLPLTLFFNGDIDLLEHNVARGSIFGHPCVRQALAVGAIRATPNFATNPLEAFSAQGPCEIFFPAFDSRTKPDLAAADGVATSLADFTPFFGTSAAAPHVAAIAALLMDVAGGPDVLSSTQIANILRVAAMDRGTPGPDNRFGYGAVDAVQASAALQALQAGTNALPQSTIDAPAEDVVIAPGATVTFQGACTDIESNGSVSAAWDFGGAAAPSSVQSPGAIVFPNPGVFPISFTCTDNVARDPTPAARMVTVDQPPVSRIDSPPTDISVTMGSNVNFAGSCSDAENHVPFSFLWFFGNGGNIDSSTLQSPGSVRFDTVGTFTATLTCTDALGIADPRPATVQILVTERQVSSVGGGGGGGGCSIRPGATETAWSLFEALGNLLLSLVVISIIYIWHKHR